jgi:DNA-directed RNA polymerase subunit M/transcription elongation factor TFIIS
MYYIRLLQGDTKQLTYYCRKCGNEDSTITESSVVVSKTNIKKSQQKFNHIVNKYTKLDPTLPRVSNINCPNESCSSNGGDGGIASTSGASERKDGEGDDHHKKVENEIIYLRYDNDNMKYIYLCANCDTIWQTENS